MYVDGLGTFLDEGRVYSDATFASLPRGRHFLWLVMQACACLLFECALFRKFDRIRGALRVRRLRKFRDFWRELGVSKGYRSRQLSSF